jgi:hypothetical protein
MQILEQWYLLQEGLMGTCYKKVLLVLLLYTDIVLSSRRSLNKSPATTAATKEDEIERKITLATEGFTTTKFCELVLKDRDRLSKENALTNLIILLQ